MGRVRRWPPISNPFPSEVTMNQADFRATTPYATFGTIVHRRAGRSSPDIHSQDVHASGGGDLRASSRSNGCSFRWAGMSAVLQLLRQRRLDVACCARRVHGRELDRRQLGALATRRSACSMPGLFLYVFAQSVIFLPDAVASPSQCTVQFGGQEIQRHRRRRLSPRCDHVRRPDRDRLSVEARTFHSWADLGYLSMAMFGAFALIVVSVLFGFNLGVWFALAMVVVRLRLHPVLHVEHPASLSHGSIRGGGAARCSLRWRCCSGTSCRFSCRCPAGD